METIFDYEVTDRELGYLLIGGSRDEYVNTTSPFKRYSDMYNLFKIRGNENKADEVFRKFLDE